MSAAAYLPAPARPPHDPRTLRLSARDGWRSDASVADGAAVTEGAPVELALLSAGGLALDDPRAPFGGLATPPWIAYAPDGALYLLDRTGRRLLRFDPCACRFAPLPCLGSGPHDPRALTRPLAIAADETRLAIAGLAGAAGRVVVIGRRDLAPRFVIERDMEPNAVAFDGRGGLAVADRKHGAILRFDPGGRPRDPIADAGTALGVAFDLDGGMLVAGETGVTRRDAAGRPIEGTIGRNALEALLPYAPVSFDGEGRLVLAALCGAAGSKPKAFAVFGEDGAELAVPPAPLAPPAWSKSGRYVAGPFDSRIADCVWDRISFAGDIPARTRLTIRTRSHALPDTAAEIADPTDPAWSEPQVWTSAEGPREFLVRSRPGRYLWAEFALAGDGAATPSLTSVALEFPRIPLRRYLPAAFAPDEISADFTDRFLAIFDRGFRSIEARLDGFGYLLDPRSAPVALLDWIGSWVGLSLPKSASEAERRRLLRQAPRLYAERGTPEGLQKLLMLHLGLDRVFAAAARKPRRRSGCGPTCPPPPRAADAPKLVLEHWRLRRWLFLGRGRLGETSRLWGENILNRSRLGGGMQLGVSQAKLERDPIRDPFHAEAHAFSVFLPAGRTRTPAARRRIEALIRREAPAHTRAVVHWVRPNMRLGVQCTLGFDTVIGLPKEDPAGLGEARLGRTAAVGGDESASAGLVLGHGARLAPAARFDPRGA